MPRVKRGTMHTKRRAGIMKRAKGFSWGRKNKIKLAKTAVMKAGQHAYNDRRKKKRTFRRLWQIRLNAALRPLGLSYSKFIHALKIKNVELDRKVLSNIAKNHPEVFTKIVKSIE
ncbi:MAG: 50S ribosomal protein L20 [Candidatus Jacksonbacteria bacterium RIFCSPLOWO2_02_FULL_43_9]|nr:MAG: 50S ribosomal protein L20 [Candidatus Jacksonbacteria bacterium RIFCSPHIGHO2_02_FULL_43_10]OGY70397.1 MAG: 50S ribosomal protein L20 [Candidatus Jacksonbacteria bacterium RIFCSPLOWO2_01_FULL_44_13]OGY73710.1 MAG: 50S ribosomal protein L20 [Candidatus Jacksonbacteria bacterium RIFCSPLOWO2_02_FULL_43_9]HAZ16591.1 50S ribosomal protein L20 [Candidatus Jacksonbacteria bacterium]